MNVQRQHSQMRAIRTSRVQNKCKLNGILHAHVAASATIFDRCSNEPIARRSTTVHCAAVRQLLLQRLRTADPCISGPLLFPAVRTAGRYLQIVTAWIGSQRLSIWLCTHTRDDDDDEERFDLLVPTTCDFSHASIRPHSLLSVAAPDHRGRRRCDGCRARVAVDVRSALCVSLADAPLCC